MARMTSDEHLARAEDLLAMADETYDVITSRIDTGQGGATDLMPQLAEVGIMAQLAQAHATLAAISPDSEESAP